jgi:hypothetical protein
MLDAIIRVGIGLPKVGELAPALRAQRATSALARQNGNGSPEQRASLLGPAKREFGAGEIVEALGNVRVIGA